MKRGTNHSAETRARRSAAIKAGWADPEVRARISAAMKAAWADPEVRARMSAAMKAAWAARREDLAILTLAQAWIYKRARKCGRSREEALALALAHEEAAQ